MSHFTRMKTEIDDPEVLRRGLEALGYAVREGGKISGYQGTRTVDLVVETDSKYDIGLVRSEEGAAFEIVADWWGISGESRPDFSRELEKEIERVREEVRDRVEEAKRAVRQQFAEERAVSKLEEQGFRVARREVDEDGTVRIVARRPS